MNNILIPKTLILAATLLIAACGDSNTPTNEAQTPDGEVKKTDGKGDAWDWRNNPERFKADLNYKWEELPKTGKSTKIAWADTYWPIYQDSINARWQGPNILSPAEKWDKAFNGWTEPAGFMDMKPYDPKSCEWDIEYYQSLGSTALWVSQKKGNWRSHNGIDDDNDGIEDDAECGYGDKKKDRDGVESWWGLCHAWVPAAILEDEPVKAVIRNGVKFEVADMKALLVMQYDKSDAYMLGGRCNNKETERDENGRLIDAKCRDVNAGSFHVIVTNFLGLQSRAIAEDRTYNYEVWNQPVIGYQITEQKEISIEDVKKMLKTTPDLDEEGLPQSDEEISAVLKVANDLSLADLDHKVGLRKDTANAIIEARSNGAFTTLQTLDDVYRVGPRSIVRMLEYARQENWAPKPASLIYSFNNEAVKFVSVKMTLDYITESDASKEPTSNIIQRYTRHDWYEYILEIDANDKIIGGEWVGSSIQSHPDFLWLPIRAISGVPSIDMNEVRDMIRESRNEIIQDTSFGSTKVTNIPDNDPKGVISEVVVDAEGTLDSLILDLEIAHEYKGDLLVTLKKVGTQSVIVFDGRKASKPWEDDLSLVATEIAGFEGVNLKGTWQLIVHDSGNGDIGKVVSWTINAKTK